jgi:hypothetical protein
MPHIIRLRGPWEYQPLARLVKSVAGRWGREEANLPAAGTIELPADWGSAVGSDFRGWVCFRRRFHQPTGLDAASRVWLVIDDVDWQARVALNDRHLGDVLCSHAAGTLAPKCPARFDITGGLLPQNALSIIVASPLVAADGATFPRPGREQSPGGLIGLVRLEID